MLQFNMTEYWEQGKSGLFTPSDPRSLPDLLAGRSTETPLFQFLLRNLTTEWSKNNWETVWNSPIYDDVSNVWWLTESCLPGGAKCRHSWGIPSDRTEDSNGSGRCHADRRDAKSSQRIAPRSPVVCGLLPVGRRCLAPSCRGLSPARFGRGRPSWSETPGTPALSAKRLCCRACGASAPPSRPPSEPQQC